MCVEMAILPNGQIISVEKKLLTLWSYSCEPSSNCYREIYPIRTNNYKNFYTGKEFCWYELLLSRLLIINRVTLQFLLSFPPLILQVVVLPRHDPHITGLKSRYRLDETLKANCTSKDSNPAANLTWLVNGYPVIADRVRRHKLHKSEEDGNLYGYVKSNLTGALLFMNPIDSARRSHLDLTWQIRPECGFILRVNIIIKNPFSRTYHELRNWLMDIFVAPLRFNVLPHTFFVLLRI